MPALDMIDLYGDEVVARDAGHSSCRALAALRCWPICRRTGIDNLPVIMISSGNSDDMVCARTSWAPHGTISTTPFDTSRIVRRRVKAAPSACTPAATPDEPAVPAVQAERVKNSHAHRHHGRRHGASLTARTAGTLRTSGLLTELLLGCLVSVAARSPSTMRNALIAGFGAARYRQDVD